MAYKGIQKIGFKVFAKTGDPAKAAKALRSLSRRMEGANREACQNLADEWAEFAHSPIAWS